MDTRPAGGNAGWFFIGDVKRFYGDKYMKKLSILLVLALLLGCFAGCVPAVKEPAESTGSDQQESTGPSDTDAPEELTISCKGVNVRQMVVDYMLKMANVKWKAGTTIDYSKHSPTLVYRAGKTYLGVVYNNNKTGLEKFSSALDSSGTYVTDNTSWDDSVGNSCATSIEHAWQQVCPSIEYGYSKDMMPYYEDTGVLGVGDIDWSAYNGKNTNTILSAHNRNDIINSYAQTHAGDCLVRYWDTDGHAMMITKEPEVCRNGDGSVNMVNSFLYVTDQTSTINNRRECPSSWNVDRKMSFSDVWTAGYLPVTAPELQSGVAPDASFELENIPTQDDMTKGFFSCTVKSNYCMNLVRLEILSGDKVVTSAEKHPYTRSFSFKVLGDAAGLNNLPSGEYTLKLFAEVGIGSITLAQIPFSK